MGFLPHHFPRFFQFHFKWEEAWKLAHRPPPTAQSTSTKKKWARKTSALPELLWFAPDIAPLKKSTFSSFLPVWSKVEETRKLCSCHQTLKFGAKASSLALKAHHTKRRKCCLLGQLPLAFSDQEPKSTSYDPGPYRRVQATKTR